MCFYPFKRICHWGPVTALGIIKLVTIVTLYCKRMWWPSNNLSGAINSYCFIMLSGMTLYNFLSAMYHGPGFLPLNWRPEKEEDCQYLQTCGVCQGYKAPRSHHCRKCGRCVQKMDHHCPWINNCVGWGNHAHFTFFLFFATLGCAHATFILGGSLYRAIHRTHYMFHGTGNDAFVYLGVYGMIFNVLALGFSIGVVIAVGMLLFFQIRAIVRNRTGIEDWIIEKANYRWRNSNKKFVFPYDVGVWRNIREVINITCHPVGDGITWPVRDGCDQFTLTLEQMAQKNEKRLKTRSYKIVKPAYGSWFPIRYGLRVCCSFPCTDEPRLILQPDDVVSVTRWRKHWLFGEKILLGTPEGQQALLRQRGWFPRICAVEMSQYSPIDTSKKVK